MGRRRKGPQGEAPTTPVDSEGGGSTVLQEAAERERQAILFEISGDRSAPDSLKRHVQATDLRILYPDMKVNDIAKAMGVHRSIVSRILNSQFAKNRLRLDVDIRPVVEKYKRNNAFKSLEYHSKVLNRGSEEIDKPDPNAAAVHAADRAAADTLKGVGVFQEFTNIAGAPPNRIDFKDIEEMLSDPGLRAALMQKGELPAQDGKGESVE